MMKKISLAILGSTATFLAKTGLVFAQTGITNPAVGNLGNDPDAAGSGSIFVGYFVQLWQAVIVFGAIAVIVYFLWGGIDWIGASGDSSKLEKARGKMLHATIGLTILVASFTLISYIGYVIFGDDFNILNLTLPTPT